QIKQKLFVLSPSLSPNPCFPIELPDARQFLLEFQHADRAHHFADRDLGVIGPEDAAILILVVVKSHFVTVGLPERFAVPQLGTPWKDRKSTRLNSSHVSISYAVFCLKKKKKKKKNIIKT